VAPDARGRAHVHDRGVPPDDPTRLDLELEIAGEPVTGFVRDRDGRVEPFSGWMALARAIDLMLEEARGEGRPVA
jgi:hypothetical protein